MYFLIVIGVICCCLLLYYSLVSYRSVRKLKAENRELTAENHRRSGKIRMLELAEEIANIGTWERSLANGNLQWSDELYRIYGVNKEETIPDTDLDSQIIAPEYREKVAKTIKSAIGTAGTFAVEYQIIQPSGLRKYVLGQGKYLPEENKLVGTIQDITELKEAVLKLRINETLLREAEKVSHSGSWEWAEGKENLLWSDEMYNIHGLFPHSVNMKVSTYQNLVHEDDQKHFVDALKEAGAKRAPFRLNYRIVRPSGEVRHVLSAAEFKRIGINDNFAYIGTTQDVTELREAQVQLEEKITALNRSNQDLEQFAYVASHDLQEPLRKIQAFGKIILNTHAAALNDEVRDYLGRMHRASDRMRTLINDLLTFSRVTRDDTRFSKIDLCDLVTKSVSEMDHIIEQKNAVVKLQVDVSLLGVVTQLHQLFQNLIGNALKFSRAGTAPYIEISTAVKSAAELDIPDVGSHQQFCVITIKDNGIGFDRDDSVRIFDLFHRQHARSEFEGTGIGLAICKKIVSYHSGYIQADSEPGAGAIFTVTLPLKQYKKN